MHTYKQENGTISRPRRALWPVVACLFLLTTVACSQTDVFADTTEGFFHMVLNRLEEDEVRIYRVDAYKMDNWYYYRIDYAYVSPVDEEWTRMELVYFGAWEIDSYFNPHWENFGDLAPRRDAYLEAVQSGIHKEFTQEEIQRHVDEFYDAR